MKFERCSNNVLISGSFPATRPNINRYGIREYEHTDYWSSKGGIKILVLTRAAVKFALYPLLSQEVIGHLKSAQLDFTGRFRFLLALIIGFMDDHDWSRPPIWTASNKLLWLSLSVGSSYLWWVCKRLPSSVPYSRLFSPIFASCVHIKKERAFWERKDWSLGSERVWSRQSPSWRQSLLDIDIVP